MLLVAICGILGQYESNALFDKIVDEARELAMNSKSA